MGTVAAALAPADSVLVNDSLSFTSAFARARFLDRPRHTPAVVGRALFLDFRTAQRALEERYAERLAAERIALAAGRLDLERFIDNAPHVGTDLTVRAAAQGAADRSGLDHYQLATLYFSAGYFSTAQAIALDALRFAIDQQARFDRNWLLAAWLTAAGRLVNSPGHTAQFLHPRSEDTFVRLGRLWQRSPWAAFLDGLATVELIGDRRWRARNIVITADAVAVVRSAAFDPVGLVYADPPYTKDHYSRYYHVYETLYRYDYPDSVGQGRYRGDRESSQFSIASTAVAAFEELFSAVAARRLPMVLSYPQDGLVTSRADLMGLLERYFVVETVLEVPLDHSTLGGSKGPTTKAVRERIYVCRS
jgi:adenine-specific DNA-methyltransferase